MRSIKLQLDYLKPQVLLNQHVIDHTIVVFGSTHIVDPKEAQQRIDSLNKQIEHKPQNKRLINKLAIANHIQIKNQYYQVAPEFAGIVGKSGNGPNDSQLVVITGGGYCIIKAAN
jgi:predicted Rossmann-fold nucleotide-binding protein